MNAQTLAKHYDTLTPEERFRLIFAAGAREDMAERDRLLKAGNRITLSMQDHAPYAHSYEELAMLVYIELLEDSASYMETFSALYNNRAPFENSDAAEDDDAEQQEGDTPAAEPEAENHGDALSHKLDVWERLYRLVMARGYVLRTKAEGWKLFCERMGFPPFRLYEGFPGFDRLKRAVALAERVAFVPEGFLRWMNEVRPAGEPERTDLPFTVEAVAEDAEAAFRERAKWWGGG
jgi:hypothetical protein